MPRASASSSRQAVYDPIDPPPQQKHFTHRRTSVKPKSTSKLPAKTESQASFTQHFPEWVGMARSNDAVIANSSGEDEEYEQTRPKKRRRKAEREKDQPTYTQYVRSVPTRKQPKYDLDEDGFEIFRDEDEVEITPMARIRQGVHERAAGLQCTDWTANNDSGDETKFELEIANSSSQLDGMAAAAVTPRAFRTPTKVRFAETIPSSQSPASFKLSTQRSQRYRDAADSPLKRPPLRERSANTRTPSKPRHSPASQIASPQKALMAEPASPLGMTQATVPPPKLPRTLKRVSTVQDSQYEDLDLPTPEEDDAVEPELEAEKNEAVADHDAEETANETYDEYDDIDYEIQPTYDPAHSALERDAARFFQTQTQAMKFETYVSNSTCSDEELLTEDEVEDEGDLDAGGKAAQQMSRGMGDAARQVSQELGDAADHPASQGLDATAGTGDGPVPSSHPAERVLDAASSPRDFAQSAPTQPVFAHSDELPQDEEERIPSSPPKLTSRAHTAAAEAGSDVVSHPGPADDDDEFVPSSPPPLRQSQISTQCTPDRPSSRSNEMPLTFTSPQRPETQLLQARLQGRRTEEAPELQRFSVLPADSLPVTSPRQTTATGTFSYPQTLPSSPFPLPPWSSPQRPRFLETQTQASRGGGLTDDLGSLADFSLPPPPPMSSSRAGTQSGGGGDGSSSPLR
ncbi:hypothetical protein LTR36_009977 [Oleoguttula mirabilis]|uniref:Uncharacterized protein n=1 Tax=Oleoguttula mirabilis TaxID=1507867 RepID=A0AAV9J4P5_9PEZI|nr:hypothetical protein LTR36_009977 [Oleoguttula mirabilis]